MSNFGINTAILNQTRLSASEFLNTAVDGLKFCGSKVVDLTKIAAAQAQKVPVREIASSTWNKTTSLTKDGLDFVNQHPLVIVVAINVVAGFIFIKLANILQERFVEADKRHEKTPSYTEKYFRLFVFNVVVAGGLTYVTNSYVIPMLVTGVVVSPFFALSCASVVALTAYHLAAIKEEATKKAEDQAQREDAGKQALPLAGEEQDADKQVLPPAGEEQDAEKQVLPPAGEEQDAVAK